MKIMKTHCLETMKISLPIKQKIFFKKGKETMKNQNKS